MDDEDIIARVGTFFLVMGLGFVIMFVASDLAETVNFDLFFIGVLLGGFGIFLRRRAPSPPPSGRFETWRKMRSGKNKEQQAQKRSKRQEETAAKKKAREEARQAKKAQK